MSQNGLLENPYRRGEREYCRDIAEIGRRNQHDMTWWASNLSAKNFAESGLWNKIWAFLEEPVVTKNDGGFGGLVVIAVKRLYRSRLLAPWRMRALLNRRREKAAQVETLLITHLDGRSFPAGSHDYHDWIWRDFCGHLTAKGVAHVIIGMVHGDEKRVVQRVFRHNQAGGQTVVPVDVFITPIDIIWAFWQTFWAKCPDLGPGVVVGGKDVSRVLSAHWRQEKRNGLLFKNFLYYRAWIRALRVYRPRRIMWPWENHTWEKMLMMAAAAECPGARTVGYQHSTVPPSLLNHFPGEAELEYAPYPDRIVCTGPRMVTELSTHGFFPEGCLVAGCAVRYENIWKGVGDKMPRQLAKPHPVVGVALSIEPDVCRDLLDLLSDSRLRRAANWRYKAHPLLPMDTLQSLLPAGLCPKAEDFSSAVDVESFCDSVDVVVYSKTTVGLEAILHGLPCVHVSKPENQADDPLYRLRAFHWSVTTVEALLDVIRELGQMSSAECERLHAKAVADLRDYLRPVDEQSLDIFLEC